MGWQSWIFDNRMVRSLPDVQLGGFVVQRQGYNFRPDWDRSIAQPWFGRWWMWLGPYLIGWPRDFNKRRRAKQAASPTIQRERLMMAFYRELTEHDYEDDEEKCEQIAYHFADVAMKTLDA